MERVCEPIDARQGRIERFDLQSVDRDDGMTLVHQIMRERIAGRPKSDDEDLIIRGRLQHRAVRLSGLQRVSKE